MRSLKTIAALIGVPLLCVGAIAVLLLIAGVFESVVVEPIQAHMPIPTQTIAAPTAIVIAPTPTTLAPTAQSFAPEGKKTGDMTGEPMDQLQGCISMVLFVIIIVIVVFAGPLQKAARR